MHAVAAGQPLPGWAAALVAAVAPISLLVDTHGLAVLFRVAATTREPVTDPVVDDRSRESEFPATDPEPEPLTAVPEPDIHATEPAGAAPVAEPEPSVVAASSAPTAAVSGVPNHSRPAHEMLPIAVPVGG